MKQIILFIISLICINDCNAQYTLFSKESSTPIQANANFGGRVFSRSVTIHGNYAAICAPEEDINGISDAGAVYIFERDNPNCDWVQIQKLTVPFVTGNNPQLRFGSSIAMNDTYIVVGALQDRLDFNNSGQAMTNAGAVYIYNKTSSNTWSFMQKITPSIREQQAQFGRSVDVYENTIIVGAPGHTNNPSTSPGTGPGAAFSFNLGTIWVQTQMITQGNGIPTDAFGFSVAIDNEIIVVGAPYERRDANDNMSSIINESGSAYIYERANHNSNWQFIQKITSSDRGDTERFGFSTEIQGNRILVGCPLDREDSNGNNPISPSPGSAFTFTRSNSFPNSIWSQEQKITALVREPGADFGMSLAIDNNTMVIGSPEDNYDSNNGSYMPLAGSAFVFSFSGNWSQTQKITAFDRSILDNFGNCVGISNGRILISAPSNSKDNTGASSASNKGSAYFYEDLEMADQPTFNSNNISYCSTSGSNVTLHISGGDLNDASQWVWYLGGCGTGTPVGYGATIFVTTPGTYYVRGEGCPPDGPCGSLTVSLSDNWHQYTKNTPNGEIVEDITTDSNGNVYITGIFNTEATLNGGANPDITMSYSQGFSAFIAKYNKCGDLQWADYSIGGDYSKGYDIAVDESKSVVYITGKATLNTPIAIKFNSTGVAALNSANASHSFVAAFDMLTGQANFVNKILHTLHTMPLPNGINESWANAIAINETNGDIYIAGAIQLNGGHQKANIKKYSPTLTGIGPLISEIRGIGPGHSIVNDLDFYEGASPGQLAVTGNFYDKIAFSGTTGGGSALYNFNLQGFFLLYQDLGLSYNTIFENGSNGGGATTGESISFDDNTGKIFITGNYTKNLLNPYNIGVNSLSTLASVKATYFIGYNPTSNSGWAHDIQTNNGSSLATSVTALNEKVYFTGDFQDDILLSTGASFAYSGQSNHHTYIISFNDVGAYMWGNTTLGSGLSAHHSKGIAIDNNNNLYVCGTYFGDMDYLYTTGSSPLTSTGVGFGLNGFVLQADKSTGILKSAQTQKEDEGLNTMNDLVTNSIDMVLLPNPSNNGIFTLVFNAPTKGALEVTNLYGQRVFTHTIVDDHKRLQLNLSDQSSGVYIVSVFCQDKVLSKKLIITK